MKKVIAILITLALMLSLSAIASADFDLSGLSYDELVALKDQINLAIWNSEEWQEVEVPYGIWIVGEDIPAGKWTVTAGDGCSQRFDIGKTLDPTGTDLGSIDTFWRLRSKNYSYYDAAKDVDQITVELSAGMIIHIDEGYVTFTPYAGKQSLGFK